MSKFAAINLSEDELDAEEHTRELQIEESFTLFKRALNLQKDNNYTEAANVYEELFKIDVINDNSSSPTINNLRYLAYRNVGFLKFDKLVAEQKNRKESNELTEEEILDLYEELTSCVDDLVSALKFAEGDTRLVELLYDIFNFFGSKRLSRFIIEYELMKNDIRNGSDKTFLILRKNKILKNFSKFLNRYKELLIEIDHYQLVSEDKDNFMNKNRISFENIKKLNDDDQRETCDLKFLQPVKDHIELKKKENLFQLKTLNIDLTNYNTNDISFSSLIRLIHESLPKPKGKQKCYDQYSLTTTPVEKVQFLLPLKKDNSEPEIANDTNEVENNKDESKVSTATTTTLTAVEGTEGENGEDKPQQTSASEARNEKNSITRSSKRLNKIANDTPENVQDLEFSEAERFVSVLNQYLSLLNSNTECEKEDIELKFNGPIDAFLENYSESKDMYIHDFVKTLSNWSHQKSELLLANIESSSNNSILEILNANTLDDLLTVEYKNVDVLDVNEFIKIVNNSSLHLFQLRILILESFLSFNDKNEVLIIDYKVDEDVYKILINFLNASDITIYNEIVSLFASDYQNLENSIYYKYLSMSISIFELLVDSYISVYQKNQKKGIEKQKAYFNELLTQKKILVTRIERWKSISQDLIFIKATLKSDVLDKLMLRYTWCLLSYMQHLDNLTSINELNIKKMLSNLLSNENLSNVDIIYLNYTNIKRLNYDIVNIQLSKLNVLTTFSNLLDSDCDSLEKIQLLELILMPVSEEKKCPFSKEQKEMEEFIHKSSLELKLKLWQILLNYYSSINNLKKYQTGIEHILNILYNQIGSEAYRKEQEFQRQQILLRNLGFYGEFLNKFIELLSKNSWKLQYSPEERSDKKNLLSKILEFMRIGFIYCLHEDVAKKSSLKVSLDAKSTKAARKVRDILTNTFSLVFLYYSVLLPQAKPEYINDLLSLLHEQLGVRSYCDSSDGKFLKLIQDCLIDLSWPESEMDLLQVIFCRYKISISVENFTPFDHSTSEISFSRFDAMEISKFVLPNCFKKKNPMFNIPKNDIKTLLDSIYKVIGDPNEKDESISRYNAVLEDYLDNTQLNVRIMRDAFYGLLTIDIGKSKLDIQEVAENGLYYLQGVMALGLFKIRKRSMQSRISELDFVLQMFKQDIICGSKRLETWLLLGQTYSLLVEDDLIWTSDKLTNNDKKQGTALLQKKSLLCYLMAISLKAETDKSKELSDQVGAVLWSSFGKELYNAAMEPMSKLVFNVNSVPKFLKLANNTKIYEKLSTNPITDKTILKILLSSFLMASRLSKDDWLNYYYISKIEYKLNLEPHQVLQDLIISCNLARSSNSSADPTIEPHYRLCSLLLKYVSNDKLTVTEAINYLNQNPILKVDPADIDRTNSEQNDLKLFAKFVIIESLKKVISYDKKNWHHKPHYKIAEIQAEILDDWDSAKETMLNLVSLKPTVKNLVTIWKPENERPGKHFVYNLQYITFFLKILSKQRDLTSLFQFAKKLRRVGSSMINLIKAWNSTTKIICDLCRKVADIDENFTEKCIGFLVYGEFLVRAKEFNNFINKSIAENETNLQHKRLQELLYLFTDFHEIKRMSNGFSQTSFIDDTFYSIYLKMYFIYTNEICSNGEAIKVAESVKSKLARKDITEIIKSMKLPKLSEIPIVYNVPEPKSVAELSPTNSNPISQSPNTDNRDELIAVNNNSGLAPESQETENVTKTLLISPQNDSNQANFSDSQGLVQENSDFSTVPAEAQSHVKLDKKVDEKSFSTHDLNPASDKTPSFEVQNNEVFKSNNADIDEHGENTKTDAAALMDINTTPRKRSLASPTNNMTLKRQKNESDHEDKVVAITSTDDENDNDVFVTPKQDSKGQNNSSEEDN
ncbi:hypothetical protein PACTADRAFT_35294 [Pachysolen tannophilus NRRL Y-2460]|uniref:Histone transcription regulator 3 homolog n=1 Tax=Pachysolen tannophilus NRRL Y-2460 TaxID=669874 RepID=A0A1E4TRU8_PACTA|nr:hypothetical protein PACTADRAFT_35294 [Pachysolen tannophilus NRRL Y-2460]